MLAIFDDARHTVRAAITLADRGALLVHAPPSNIEARCEEYWLASHERNQRWGAALRVHEAPYTLLEPRAALERWFQLHGLLEEILAAGILTRVWTAIASAVCQDFEVAAYLQSAYIGHMGTHRRALKLILKDSLSFEQATRLDRLRRRSERWTDLLLAHVADSCDVKEFAVDTARVADFAETLSTNDQRDAASILLLKSLDQPIGQNLQIKCPHPALNRRIAESILACLGPDVCESIGSTKGLWQVRLSHTFEDVVRLVRRLSGENEGVRVQID